MPVMDGLAATREIRDIEKQYDRHIPIIALTANALAGDREKYINAGMDNYLSKPLELEMLSLLLEEYFSRKVIKDDNETIDNTVHKLVEESQSNISDIEDNMSKIEVEKIVKKEIKVKRKSDILLYHSVPLIANLYKIILNNLKYNIDMVTNENEFMDMIEIVEYTSVIYDVEPFMDMKCMIADVIRDNGAKPFVFVKKEFIDESYCAEALCIGMEFDEMDKKLKSI